MLNDKMYRQFRSSPFQKEYEGSQKLIDLRETLLIDEIIKCGKDILGSIEMEIKDQSNLVNESNVASDRTLEYKRSRSRYIYEYDYGKDRSIKQQRSDLDDHSAEQISFTLSNEDNPRKLSLDSRDKYSLAYLHTNPTNQNHVSWKKIIINDHRKQQKQPTKYISDFIRAQLTKTDSRQKIGKWKKPNYLRKDSYSPVKFIKSKKSSPQKIQVESPIESKDTLGRKTFQFNKSKVNYFTEQTKKRKFIFQPKSNQKNNQSHIHLNYSTYNPCLTNTESYHTPEKNIKRKTDIPLSQQITKNIYGRMKQEVNAKSFIKQFQLQQKKRIQQSDQIWKNFIDRSDKWIQNKKNHLIERQSKQKYQPFSYLTKSTDFVSLNKQNLSQIELKINQQNDNKKQDWLKVQETKFQPQFTFKNNKIQNQLPKKRQSSVQNCINKLKTQTQLLKVKLLSPFKKQINDNQMLHHYKEINQPQSRKLVRKFSSKRQGQNQRTMKNMPGFSYIKNVYGRCIGEEAG